MLQILNFFLWEHSDWLAAFSAAKYKDYCGKHLSFLEVLKTLG
jgi:hypothetical protein